jgi:hypothetical protein
MEVGLKTETWDFVAYKKQISMIKTNIHLGWKEGKNIFQANAPLKQAELVLLSDKNQTEDT